MALALAFGPAYAVAVAAAAGGEGCPAPRDVSAALEARLPGVTTPDAPDLPAGALRLSVSTRAGVAAFELVEASGALRLRRQLGPSQGDCAALADTVALIVERYLIEIGYRGPGAPDMPEVERAPIPSPSPPPLPPPIAARAGIGREIELRAGAGLRAGLDGGSDNEATLGVGLRAGRVSLALSGGIGSRSHAALGKDATATLRRVPVRTTVRVSFAAGPGAVEPAAGFALDLVRVDVQGLDRQGTLSRMAPALEAGLGYAARASPGAFVSLEVAGGLGLRQYDFVVEGVEGAVFRTPRAYIRAGLNVGFTFEVTENEHPRH